MSGDAQQLAIRAAWQRFLDEFEAMRPELYRYCRYLTRSPWDAEDLVQDTLMRAFVTLATLFSPVPNPRAWLFRVASNLWIDRVRHARFEQPAGAAPIDEAAPRIDLRGAREAAGTLLVRLSPQERAAVVLKDVFDFSLDEIAATLTTTPNAVKAALHRGRTKLTAPPDEPARAPAPGALDALCAAFNAHDIAQLTALLLDSATVGIVGVVTEYGAAAALDPERGSFANTMTPFTSDERGGVRAAFLTDYTGGAPTCEVRAYRDSHVLLFWYGHTDGPAVRGVMTVVADGDRIAEARGYVFSPDVIAEVCGELGVPYRVNGYSYWP